MKAGDHVIWTAPADDPDPGREFVGVIKEVGRNGRLWIEGPSWGIYEANPTDVRPGKPKLYPSCAVKCPTCKAGAGHPCRYVMTPQLAAVNLQRPNRHSERTLQERRRVGKPTLKPHNDRLRAYAALMERRTQDALKKQYKPIVYRAAAVRKSYAAALHRENEELCEWLREHAHIFSPKG